MESRLTEEERALVTDATRKLLSVVDCFDPVACDSAMSNIMLVVSSIADARARRARELLDEYAQTTDENGPRCSCCNVFITTMAPTRHRADCEVAAELAALGGK